MPFIVDESRESKKSHHDAKEKKKIVENSPRVSLLSHTEACLLTVCRLVGDF
jgi:hypothetical protein